MTERDRLMKILQNQGRDGGFCLDGLYENSDIIADYLIENGIIVLPCKANSKCFVINNFLKDADKIISGTIVGFGIYKDGMTMYISYTNEPISDERLISDFGKNVFLTYEKAEKTLKEREDNDKNSAVHS